VIFSLCVQAAPNISQGNQTALKTAQAIVDGGHTINRVFFYLDGVQTGSSLLLPHQNEPNLTKQWQQLAKDHAVELVVCVAAALRRGVVNEQEAGMNDLPCANLADGFTVGGLGLWVESAIEADRVLTFK
jgi:tRNA 2-thiouridine synthesizing protein D